MEPVRKLFEQSLDDRPKNGRGDQNSRQPPEPNPRAGHNSVRGVTGAEAVFERRAIAALAARAQIEAGAVGPAAIGTAGRNASRLVRFHANAISVERAHRSPEIVHEERGVFQTVASD